MKVRVRKTIGIIIIVLAALNLCLFAFISIGTRKLDSFFGLSSLIALVIGIVFLRGIYLEVSESSLILKALIGTAHKTYPIGSRKNISLEGNDLFLVQGENRQKLPVYSWLAEKKDWEALARWLAGENTSGRVQ